MLAQPGQDLADVAAKVADEMGRPLGPATMFTGLAISIFCPGAVASLANGAATHSAGSARYLTHVTAKARVPAERSVLRPGTCTLAG